MLDIVQNGTNNNVPAVYMVAWLRRRGSARRRQDESPDVRSSLSHHEYLLVDYRSLTIY